MRLGNSRGFLIGTLALVALLAGCSSGNGSSIPAASGMMANAQLSNAIHKNKGTGGGIIFATQMYGNDLSVYQRGGQAGLNLQWLQNYTGLSEPQGAMSTQNGWLYVANEGANNVLIYRLKKTKVQNGGSLTDYNELPVNVALTSDRNLVAVSNKSTVSGGGGSLCVYLDRASSPARCLTYGSESVQGMGAAIDRQGDCYWSFNTRSGGGSVVEFSGCSGSGTPIVTGLQTAGGLAFDQSGNLYYIDTGAKTVYRCTGTSGCTIFAGPSDGLEEPLNMNFDYKSKDLWVADNDGNICGIVVKPGKGNGHGHKGQTVVCTEGEGGTSSPPFGVAPERN